jgi:hypothetical protein
MNGWGSAKLQLGGFALAVVASEVVVFLLPSSSPLCWKNQLKSLTTLSTNNGIGC